jgi:hypothetical protein
VFDVLTWSGNSATRTLTGLGFTNNVGLAWVKNRSSAINHVLQDAVRGFTTGKKLSSNLTDSEGLIGNLDDSYGYISGASATGFTIDKSGAGQDWVQMNASGSTYVGWAWDAGTSTVTNDSGSISSQVRANATAGFSVVTYTVGNNTSQTIGHGLGVAPQLIIVKERNQSNNWFVYHNSIGNGNYLSLNTTTASTASNLWNSTSPTSTVFTIRSGGSSPTYDGRDHVAYCFSPVVGYSSVSSYVGNGSSDGPFMYTGFRPRWILVRSTSGARDWLLYDTARGVYNENVEGPLQPNTPGTPYTNSSYVPFDILSNGFKPRAATTNFNASGETHIYLAFAEAPFNYSRAR